ncbi:DUF4372 domain-containing protein [uncultured Capnocytophaga sp.]|uniref:DUF4372 domain-containing protein n=1 Tax=uncultured Capnocytophaga sp. TaxID=159273 RepID=UPI002626BFD4|nr:DUF4372 domain-containing protein [uncultured Capnocytophaga sp.]
MTYNYYCPINFENRFIKLELNLLEDSAFLFPLYLLDIKKGISVSKSTYFFGQPLYGQITFLLDKDKILKISQELEGERYIKKFDIWHHLNSMLYATIIRLDSLREIEIAMTAESRKLRHLGLTTVPKRSTLADANEKRPEGIFGAIYADLYNTTKDTLLSDMTYFFYIMCLICL